MRKDVKKYLFYGHHKALEGFFTKAQELGLVHFINTSDLKAKEAPQSIQNLTLALKTLRSIPAKTQEEPESITVADRFTQHILELKQNIEKLEEEERINKLEIARIEVYGNFSLSDISFIETEGHRKCQFFVVKKGLFTLKSMPDDLIYIASENGLDYFSSIRHIDTISEAREDKLIPMRIDHELKTLKNRSQQIHAELVNLKHELNSYGKYNHFLHEELVRKYDDHHLKQAKEYAASEAEGAIFAIDGWVPIDRIDDLKQATQNLDIEIFEVKIEENDVVPTYLENEGLHRVGEDLVDIYDVPSNTDKDPSLWVLWSFAVFFSIIIGDGGYGLLFLLGALYIRYKNPKMRKTELRVWKLGLILFSSCILWGILTNSFFGMSISLDSPLRKVSVLHWLAEKKAAYHFNVKDAVYQDWSKKYPAIEQAKTSDEFIQATVKGDEGHQSSDMLGRFNDGILMELALSIGIIHIIISFLRYIKRNPTGLGWIIGMIGAYLCMPEFLQASSMAQYLFGLDRAAMLVEGKYMIALGLGLALGTAFIKNVISLAKVTVLGLVQALIFGLLEALNGIQIFSDVLSYLRLYALGLAGSIISATINDITGSLIFLLAAPIALFGHGINMVLAIMGGVIHGLRLNFIEWYHYSFEGGGKRFNPLKKIEQNKVQ